MEFDLVDQTWIPVVVRGRRTTLSMREALCNAHQIDGLSIDDPLQTVAVFRQVLLPVVLDALGVPRNAEEWEQRWLDERLDVGVINAYLDANRGRFDLFDDVAPFAQVAGLQTERNETKPVLLILPAEASGNNVPLFSSRTEADRPSLTPAEAVRALLAVHCWDTAAIKSGAVGDPQVKSGKTTGNPTGPAGQLGVVIPMGATLRDTLVLNTPIVYAGRARDDVPQWRREPASPAWTTRPALGLLDLLTWQSRRVRLLPESDSAGDIVVRRVVVAAGDRLSQTPDFEPHTAWRQNVKPAAGAPASLPARHVQGKEAWRGLTALLATDTPDATRRSAPSLLRQFKSLRGDSMPDTTPLRVLTVGMQYGNQSAVVEDVMVDQIPLPIAALDPDGPVRQVLDEVVSQAEALRVAANRLGDDLRAACGADKIAWDQGQRLGDQLVHAFTPVVHRLLTGLQREPECSEDARAAWVSEARRIARQMAEPMLASAPPEAFFGKPDRAKASSGKEPRMHRLATAEASYLKALRDVLGPLPNGPESKSHLTLEAQHP